MQLPFSNLPLVKPTNNSYRIVREKPRFNYIIAAKECRAVSEQRGWRWGGGGGEGEGYVYMKAEVRV